MRPQVPESIQPVQSRFGSTRYRSEPLSFLKNQEMSPLETKNKVKADVPMIGPPFVIWFGTVTLMMPWI